MSITPFGGLVSKIKSATVDICMFARGVSQRRGTVVHGPHSYSDQFRRNEVEVQGQHAQTSNTALNVGRLFVSEWYCVAGHVHRFSKLAIQYGAHSSKHVVHHGKLAYGSSYS